MSLYLRRSITDRTQQIEFTEHYGATEVPLSRVNVTVLVYTSDMRRRFRRFVQNADFPLRLCYCYSMTGGMEKIPEEDLRFAPPFAPTATERGNTTPFYAVYSIVGYTGDLEALVSPLGDMVSLSVPSRLATGWSATNAIVARHGTGSGEKVKPKKINLPVMVAKEELYGPWGSASPPK